MIVLFTDFGLAGPYIGQMKAVLNSSAPEQTVIDLFSDAPAHMPHTNAYLLAAYSEWFEQGTVFLAVVDPGVGSHHREPIAVCADGRWYVGPGNGLFDIVVRRASKADVFEISWRPKSLSRSFHGRDLFAPVAAMLSCGDYSALQPVDYNAKTAAQWPDELAEVIYIDHFGNLITGLRARELAPQVELQYKGQRIMRVDTFSDVAVGSPLCYENSNGLLEIALNQGRAVEHFSASIGDELHILE